MFKPSLEVLEDRTMPSGNFGSGNAGFFNPGSGNSGSSNIGSGNIGSFTVGQAVAPYVGWLTAAAAQGEAVAAQALAVAVSFEAAFAASVHPAVVGANNSLLIALTPGNLLEWNSPAIAVTLIGDGNDGTPGTGGNGGQGGWLYGNGGNGY